MAEGGAGSGAVPAGKQERAFYRLSQQQLQEAGGEVRQTGQRNGARTVLQYPVVTRPTPPAQPASFSATLRRQTAKFLGLEAVEEDWQARQTLWRQRRIRLANRKYGGVEAGAGAWCSQQDPTDGAGLTECGATMIRPRPSLAAYLVEGAATAGRQLAGHSAPHRPPTSKSFLPSQQPVSPPTQEDELFFNITKPEEDGEEGLGLERLQGVPQQDQADQLDQLDRGREFGIGVVGDAMGRDYRRSLRRNPDILQQLEDIDDYRPYFTYWVTTVQVVIMVISLALYGFGPLGIELSQSHGQVLSRGLFIEEVDYLEPSNFWLGPRAADLIHLGAKFSPCMRSDREIVTGVAAARAREAETGCCVRNDNSGCVQSQQEECSTLLSTWHKWSAARRGPDGRVSGPVCGQDPQYCTRPKSSYGATWRDNITQWPVCLQSSLPPPARPSNLAPGPAHLTCETVARPCCIGIHGKCEIRTKEFCDFVQGSFHPEATLCSQVSCMEDVCGMLPFVVADHPDQFYRLWTSLFLHAGLLHLLITVTLQLYLMRDMEKLCGPARMAVIYLGAGVAGNLASATFAPYRAESGPAGAQFGVLATLIVEVLNVWPILLRPDIALGKLLAIAVIFFLLGLLPWVDNFAHLFGFLAGFLLSYALMPYIAYDQSVQSRQRRALLIGLCLASAAFLLLVLALVFYFSPIHCSWCKYLTCIPFTKDFCADQNINFKKDEPLISF